MHRLPIVALGFFLTAGIAHGDYVTGLDPNGDNFLSLRTGPGSGYREIRRMGPDTVLEVFGRRGPWRHVRLRDGLEGWAFGRYIAPGIPPGGPAPGDAGTQQDEGEGGAPPDNTVDNPPDDMGGTDANADGSQATESAGGAAAPPPPAKHKRKVIPYVPDPNADQPE